MMQISKHKVCLIFLACYMILSSCKKDFLDKKSDSSLLTPATLGEFRALLDNMAVISETPVLGELSADNYYLPQNFWTSLNAKEKSGYVWDKDIYHGTTGIGDWDKPYQQVFYANVVLEGLEKMEGPDVNSADWKDLKGAALFIRAYAFHNLAQVFSPVYDANAVESLGIALRLTADINVVSKRATLKETYDQIINDLKEAVPLFKNDFQIQYFNRPSRAAANALLARVYLCMRDYQNALQFANSSLALYSTLLHYGSAINLSNNPEVLYQSRLLSTTSVLKSLVVPALIVDSTLYASYNINDRRRSLYFNMAGNPRVGYSSSIFMFSGLATDEVYLIKSESLARTGNYNEGINVLNTLLSKRFPDTAFTTVTADNQQEALDTILLERRKELIFRGLRWSDIRRLNKDGANITLRRKLGSQEYILPPNHPNYVLPLPPDVTLVPNLREQL